MMEVGFLPDFMLRALFIGVGVALLAGPLGSFIVWQRMAYFGDALAHASLLGVTLSLAFEFNITLGVIIVALTVAMLLVGLKRQTYLANDTLLGILSHSGLALGLLTLNLVKGPRIDILGYLYGDILAVSWQDVALIYIGGAFILLVLMSIWRSLLSATVHAELAKVEGIAVERLRLIYMCLLAFVIAIAIKVVGVLLMTALLVIPVASGRRLANTPEQLAMLASVIGVISVIMGLYSSYTWDVPTGPAIVCSATAIFGLSFFVPKK